MKKCLEEELQPPSGQPVVVPFEPRTLNHLAILILESLGPMMFALVVDIVDNLLLVTNAAGERAIFFSPAPEMWETRLPACPLAAALLDVAHQVAERHCGRQLNQQMHMVAYTVDADKPTASALDDSRDVSI